MHILRTALTKFSMKISHGQASLTTTIFSYIACSSLSKLTSNIQNIININSTTNNSTN